MQISSSLYLLLFSVIVSGSATVQAIGVDKAEARRTVAMQLRGAAIAQGDDKDNEPRILREEDPLNQPAPEVLPPAGFTAKAVCVNKSLVMYRNEDFTLEFGAKFRPETFYGKNLNFFSGSPLDQALYWQTTFDLKLAAQHAQEMKFLATLRNKTRWGNPRLIPVTPTPVKVDVSLTPPHNHYISRLLFWIREAWLEISLNKALSICADREHVFKVGFFPFDLGRGIALGDAYAVTPGVLGLFADNAIDQYAPGMLLHGDVTKNGTVTYDLYAAILENFSDSFDNNSQEIYSQRLGACDGPFRGFGHIDWVLAARMKWVLFNDPLNYGKTTFEPYVVYNHLPEQRIEFPADAASNLITWGLALDYAGPRWEFGWETAINRGAQQVFAWDRNNVVLARNSSNGAIIEQYSQVFVGPKNAAGNNNAPFSSANQAVVNSSPREVILNGQQLDASGLYNGPDRFRRCYKNQYNGMMMVADAAYYMMPKCLRVSGTVGWASGDENPNQNFNDPLESQMDGTYDGFIGIQEVYSGRLVRSVFVIGSQRIPRPLTTPSVSINPNTLLLAQNISGFSNLLYTGVGFKYTPQASRRRVELMPNCLFYWQDIATKKFSAVLGRTIDEPASKFLGFEVNLFLELNLLDNLRFFFVGGTFIPGTHFVDIAGKPLNSNQIAVLQRLNTTGITDIDYPLLGTRPAYALNAGMEYRF
ncbi:hypothetical protein M1466_00090 [Candidatus Dependentiae bacterium]|nr:hypothetical protein [Candidatus Dependentiae bacterium]